MKRRSPGATRVVPIVIVAGAAAMSTSHSRRHMVVTHAAQRPECGREGHRRREHRHRVYGGRIERRVGLRISDVTVRARDGRCIDERTGLAAGGEEGESNNPRCAHHSNVTRCWVRQAALLWIFRVRRESETASCRAGTPRWDASREAAEVARLIQQCGNVIVVHPLVLADIARDRNAERRAHREYVLKKYPVLEGPPSIGPQHQAVLGSAAAGSNDWVDNHLLAAVERDAVDYVITQDNAMHTGASRLGISDRVLTTADALVMLRALFPTTPAPPPAVLAIKAHALDEHDPIFASFRADYEHFDQWLRKCKRQDRPTWVIDGQGGLAAVCIAKPERDPGYGMAGAALKICSFKVSDSHVGARYGELLLKTLFVYAHENAFDWI